MKNFLSSYLPIPLLILLWFQLAWVSCTNGARTAMDVNRNIMNETHKPNDMADWNEVLRQARKGSLAPDQRVVKSEAEWEALLSPEVFHITRKKGTERAYSGAYCSMHEAGTYACVCCATPLFGSAEKFDSGSGWPSFTQAVKNNVIKYEKDNSFGMLRVEVICSTCDAHLGHVFPDGPGPGGLRFCINSASIQRIEDEK